MLRNFAVITALAFTHPAFAQEEQPAPSPGQIVDSAEPEEWVSIPANDLMVMTLEPDSEGNPREVVIQLMPKPFSQGWVDNIRLLAREGWYDGTAIIRVQDNYVTQWGDPDADSENAKPLPKGLKVMEEEDYEAKTINLIGRPGPAVKPVKKTWRHALNNDAYSAGTAFVKAWPIGKGLGAGMWPVHCYGMVGVARGMSPDTGDGSSLYTVIGHAPRHLDRNIALVGRVIEGMEHLSSLPRGKGELGFYEDPDRQTTIASVEMANDFAEFPQPTFEYLSTDSDAFARYADARANRRDPFFIQPAGGADICNIPVPVRRVVTD